jgi:hypothetical protein
MGSGSSYILLSLNVLEARLLYLEARLARRSGNCSLPPSADPPGAPSPAQPKRTGRCRGAQPGHPRHSRTLQPPERLTHTEVLKPDACRRCGRGLTGEDPVYRLDLFASGRPAFASASARRRRTMPECSAPSRVPARRAAAAPPLTGPARSGGRSSRATANGCLRRGLRAPDGSTSPVRAGMYGARHSSGRASTGSCEGETLAVRVKPRCHTHTRRVRAPEARAGP